MTDNSPWHLFDVVGIELEYMIVEQARLDVAPLCDRVMAAEAGEVTAEIEFPDITWNNELVLHVIEFKTTTPVPTLDGLAGRFHRHLNRAGAHLASLNACLLPTGMHPWMFPSRETTLWPHECGAVYTAFDRVFGCRGHGWSNLQSLHINLPFHGDEEFGRLHAAIRLLMAIMPALAASSPFVDGRPAAWLDHRLEAYRTNCARIPSITGQIIPEPIFSIDAYHTEILERIYRDLAPLDPEGILHHEWVNARGAIARFDRGSIEIRVLDVQECPEADLAVVAVVVAVLRLLTDEVLCDVNDQQGWPVEPLVHIFEACAAEGLGAIIDDEAYLHSFAWPGPRPCTTGQLWSFLMEQARQYAPGKIEPHDEALGVILREGNLAQRLRWAAGANPTREELRRVYRRLSQSLPAGSMATRTALKRNDPAPPAATR